MASVREITPIKLSGLSSLFVEFGYDPELVDLMRSFRPAVWHKKLKGWELPSSCLSRLLDELSLRGEVELTLKDGRKEGDPLPPLSEEEIASFKQKPFAHQVEAVDFMLRQKKSLLLDSMGIGKGPSMIWYAETLGKRGLIDHCLVVCGINSIKLNFFKEIKRFSNLPARVLGMKVGKKGRVSYSTVPERAKELKAPIDEFFVVTNIETLRSDAVIEAISKGANKFGLIMVDEVHRALGGNSGAKQAANLRKLKADFKVAATGTLITNDPMSAYGPLSWTENDHATLTNYKAQYCDFGGFNGYQVVGYHGLDVLQEEIDSCSIRRTFDQVRGDMPAKTVEYELVEMDEAHRKFYEAIKEGVKEEADKVDLKANNLLALTTRLRQATASPSSLTSNPVPSSKVERCAEIVEELVSQGEKVVVLSTFVQPVYELAERLKGIRLSVNTGDVDDAQVSANVDRFQNDPEEMVFVGTHAKAGTGLSLPAARYMVMIDTPWTYSQFGQSCDRIYRIVSDRNVFVRVLACADTIDERVRDIVETKKELSDYLVDGKADNRFADALKDIIRSL